MKASTVIRAIFIPSCLLFVSPSLLAAQDGLVGISPAVGLTLGTSGIGGELSIRPHAHFGARFGVGWIPIDVKFEGEDHDVTEDAELPSPIVRVMADYFPFGGAFHLTAGIEHFSGGVVVSSVPTEPVEIGGTEYPAEEIGEIEGTFWGRETAPYLGLGWQKSSSRVQPYFELGVAITGSPEASIRVLGPAAGETDLEEDLAEEIEEIEDDASAFVVYPHVMFGLRVRLGS